MSTENAEKPGLFERLLEGMAKDFQRLFFGVSTDLKAAYAVGVYLQSGMYFQRKKLRTRGLTKKLRYLLDQLDRTRVLKVFAEVNQVMLAVHSADENAPLSNRLRERAEVLLSDADWTSSPEELSLAFMMGFDLFQRSWSMKDGGLDE